MIAVFTIYFTLPWIALSALPVRCDAAGEDCTTLLGVAEEDGGYADNPMLGIVSAMDLGPLQAAAELYVGVLAVTILVAATNAGVLGRLAPGVLDGHPPPDARRAAAAAPALPHAVPRHPRFSALACVAVLPGQADFLGAIYAFGAMLSFSMAHLAAAAAARPQPTSRARTAARAACGSAATTCRRWRSRASRARRSRCSWSACSTSPSPPPALVAAARHRRLRRLPPQPGARPRLHPRGRDPRSRWSTTRPSTTRCSSTSATDATTPS